MSLAVSDAAQKYMPGCRTIPSFPWGVSCLLFGFIYGDRPRYRGSIRSRTVPYHIHYVVQYVLYCTGYVYTAYEDVTTGVQSVCPSFRSSSRSTYECIDVTRR